MHSRNSNTRPKLSQLINLFCRTACGLILVGLICPLLVSASAFTCTGPTNVALSSNGATVSASSSFTGHAASGAINGDRRGLFVWQNGYWAAASTGSAWLEVQFNGSKTISEIDVVVVQDNYLAPVEPTDTMTFGNYGMTAYDVQYWNGSSWVTVSGGSVTGNNKVWRKFSFSPVTTTRIRVVGNAAVDGLMRVIELEAWTGPSPAPRYNLAMGTTATASSIYGPGFEAVSVINGDRKGLNAGSNGNWNDAPPANTFPDWLQIDFGTNKTIDEVDVFSLQDNWTSPVEPTESTTFTLYGMSGFDVQYWNGTAWVGVPGGSVTGNNKIWKKITFSPITTSKIRILTNASPSGSSVLTEVEVYAPVTSSCEPVARLDPMNQTGGSGENPLSRNFNWRLPLVSLPGRAGMDLNLSLSYNSLVWTRSGGYISFDDDRGSPSPGFRLGFPVIQPLYYNAEVGQYAFMVIGSDGGRTELRRLGSSSLYEAADSSHLLLDAGTMTLRATDGTQLRYELKGSEFQCTEIKDRNGNYITINYTPSGRIDNVIDTLARTIEFNYDVNGRLTSIDQTWGSSTQHIWAAFEYVETTIQTSFTDLTVSGPANGSKVWTLSKVTLADGSHYDFSYTSWGQVWKVSSFAPDNHLLNYRAYNLPGSLIQATGPQGDCPRFTERRDWAENWNLNGSGVEQEAITLYAEPAPATWNMPDNSTKSGVRAQVTSPDGTVNKIYFIGTATDSGWRRGLPALVETYSGGNWQRKVMTTWTQDDEDVSYPLNPRVLETNVYDPAGNRARVRMTYQQSTFANGTSCWLPRDVYEYAADATAILRSTRTDYHPNTIYTDRRILGLVTERRIYEGDVNNGGVLKSKVGFFYDNENSANSIQGADAPVQHDNTNYSASFVTGRANVSSVRRYDVTNTAQFTTTSTKYNTAGAVVSNTDASGHVAQISYADSFSDGVSRSTFAYPTKLTDPDGYYSTSKYNYDFGAVTHRQTPPANFNGSPANQPAGPAQTFLYDPIGRLQQVTNAVNDAYTRYVYSTSQIRVDTYATIQDGLGEAHSFKFTDGAGRLIGTATEHPGSNGGYSGQTIIYDVMGRVIKASNPTETSAVGEPSEWAATGDDAVWRYSQQSYDWKGRPLVTTNPNGTTSTASYSGCGCAGGEVVTLTDEGTLDGGVAKRRQQKVYSDILGRHVKTELLNWSSGSVYSTTVNMYNARNQIELITQYVGAEGSATHQETTLSYDGYGRLQSRHLPQQDQNTATVWTYNSDDTVSTITDARGAVTTFGYMGTNRHLVKQVTHTLTGKPTLSTFFTHDAAGNRLSMSDGAGSVNYVYNQLSQLTSETRNLTGVGSFTLTYAYNLNGQLGSITDPFGAQVGYSYDKIGRLSAVSGSNFASVSSYASGFQYRAWGALKSLTYGNSKTLSMGYDANLNVSTYEIPGLMKKSYEYYDDGRIKFIQDQSITNSKFDRLYKYDHIGRITSALSGAEARGQGSTNDRPYNETLAYDAMGHLTLRELRHWDRYDTTGNETYINNRRQYWQYDADGRLLSGSSQYTYDAAGQVSTFGDGDPYETDQQLDGDGRRIKSVQRRYDLQTNQWVTEKITYYIHSSVIGEPISEVSAAGAKERSFVFAGAEVMAIQSAIGGQFVSWQHYDASNASYRGTNSLGQTNVPGEMDPFGADAGVIKPFTWPAIDSPGKLEPYYGVPELNSAFSGCILDNIPVPCDLVTNDNSMQCTNNHCGPVLQEKIDKDGKVIGQELSKPFQAWADGGFGYLPRSAVYAGKGRYRFPQTNEALQGPINRHHAAVPARNPVTIEGTGNSKNCDLSVSFDPNTHYGTNPNLKNGPSVIKYQGQDSFGLGFTVTGRAIGGVGRIGHDSNPQNPGGSWVLEQWTASYREANGVVLRNDKAAWMDISKDINYEAKGDTFSYYDHPGSTRGWGINRYQNFLIKVYNGKEYCQVAFHFVQEQRGPGYELHWYKGLRH